MDFAMPDIFFKICSISVSLWKIKIHFTHNMQLILDVKKPLVLVLVLMFDFNFETLRLQ